MEKAGVHRLLLGGVSDVARIVIEQVDGSGISVLALLDNDHEGSSYEGIPVIREEDVGKCEWDGILITALDDVEALTSACGERVCRKARSGTCLERQCDVG